MLTKTSDSKYELTITKAQLLNIAAGIVAGEYPEFDPVAVTTTKNAVVTAPSLTESDYAELRFEFDAPDEVTTTDPLTP